MKEKEVERGGHFWGMKSFQERPITEEIQNKFRKSQLSQSRRLRMKQTRASGTAGSKWHIWDLARV